MWNKARKKPIVVEYREPKEEHWLSPRGYNGQVRGEIVRTLEGQLIAIPGRDYVMKGVDGELYPINIEIFEKTYDRLKGDKEDIINRK